MQEMVMKINRTDAHAALAADRATARADYMASGQFSTDWTVWVALDTYLQLQENIAGGMYQEQSSCSACYLISECL